MGQTWISWLEVEHLEESAHTFFSFFSVLVSTRTASPALKRNQPRYDALYGRSHWSHVWRKTSAEPLLQTSHLLLCILAAVKIQTGIQWGLVYCHLCLVKKQKTNQQLKTCFLLRPIVALLGQKEDKGHSFETLYCTSGACGLERMAWTWDGGTRAPVRKSLVYDSWRSFTHLHTPFDSERTSQAVVGAFSSRRTRCSKNPTECENKS